MEQKICTFAGHTKVYCAESIKIKLKKEIINLIENHGVTIFYNGGKSNFDRICAACVKELKNKYPFIKSYLILAYIPGKQNQFYDNFYKNFDGTFYPGIEKIPTKFAIIKRNEWMIDKSDFLIAYVDHNWGGAYQTFKYAKKKEHIKWLNIFVNR